MNENEIAQNALKGYFGNIQQALNDGREFEMTITVKNGGVEVDLRDLDGNYLCYYGDPVGWFELENVSAAVLAVNDVINDVEWPEDDDTAPAACGESEER